MNIYSTKDAFEIYLYYVALKRHFTSSYDFFKYNGKTKASQASFESRRDKFFFYSLSKRKDSKQFILANMIAKPNLWIGDPFNDSDAEEVFNNWVKRQQSLSYVFSNELSELNEDFNSNLIIKNGQYPNLLSLYNTKRIGIETLIIIDDLFNVFSYWETRITDTIIFPQIKMTVKKVKPFMVYDKEKMKQILLKKFTLNM